MPSLRKTPFPAMLCSPWVLAPSSVTTCLPASPASRASILRPLSHIPSSLRGERYIGMWQADQRHGPGVVVTQAGVCYQGTFQGDKMAVSGSPCLGYSVAESKPSCMDDKGCSAVPSVYCDGGKSH